MALKHFLIVFNLVEQELLDFREFDEDIERATDAYEAMEKMYRNRDDHEAFEIVLVGADSRDTLEVTHSRYFSKAEAIPF